MEHIIRYRQYAGEVETSSYRKTSLSLESLCQKYTVSLSGLKTLGWRVFGFVFRGLDTDIGASEVYNSLNDRYSAPRSFANGTVLLLYMTVFRSEHHKVA